MVEGGGEGAGRGVTSSGPPGGGGAAGRRNREVTFNPSGAGREGLFGLGSEERGALGRGKAPGCGALGLGGRGRPPRRRGAPGKIFSPFFLNSASIPIWREE